MDRDQFTCQHIVRALRNGPVPAHGLARIAVGRDDALRCLRADLQVSDNGGAWVRCVSGDSSAGKTFFCSLVREEAWQRGFIVAAADLGRDALLHRFDFIYQRIMEAMRADHFREVPAFDFILQEWLFNLEQEVQRSTGLEPLNPVQQGEVSRLVAQRISQQLARLRIEVAVKVREAHGIAHQWKAIKCLTDDMLTRLIEAAAAHFRGRLITVPRWVLKVLVYILDELQRSVPSSAAEILATGIDPERVEAIERQAPHLVDHI